MGADGRLDCCNCNVHGGVHERGLQKGVRLRTGEARSESCEHEHVEDEAGESRPASNA